MAGAFRDDVFLSHTSKDNAVVRPLAERLRADGLRVWFDEWEIQGSATKAAQSKQIEEGLEHSRVLVLGMSANAFGSGWARLELGVKLTRRAEGSGELEVYFDHAIPIEEKIIFSQYVHEHLLRSARDVVRLRHYVCPHCGTPAGNREVAMKKLAEGKKDIPCVNCDDPKKRIPLWDELEELFASPKTKQTVRDLRDQSDIKLDNESKERALVGEVISTVALAGQLSREFNVSDHGIDMEIEFKNDADEATGRKLYLQLKSGDSYMRERKSDGAEIFTIKDERHVRYWMAQAFPVLLVIRDSRGEVRWMEVRDWLKRESNQGKKPVKQIVFDGERFDVMSVRRWREKVLGQESV